MATLFGLQSLAYPLGRDQGLFFYAAREWLLRGHMLYRDVWDHKPPVIYFVYMLAIRLFGEHAVSIRILELVVAVPAIAWATLQIAVRRDQTFERGAFGATWLGVSVLYYGYHTFWETGQSEIWGALFAALGLVAAMRARRETLGYALAGVLSAVALFTKPPMICFVLITACAVIVRARERPTDKLRAAVLGLSVFALAGGALGGAILGYFALHNALEPMLDILVGANAAYLDQERGYTDAWDFVVRSSWTVGLRAPFSNAYLLAAACATCLGILRRDRSLPMRYALPLALALACYGTGAMQLKFYAYHWVPIVLAQGVFVATLYTDFARTAREQAKSWLAPLASALIIPGMFVVSGLGFQQYTYALYRVVRYELGVIDREEYTRTYDTLFLGYSYRDAEMAGRWIRKFSKPTDTIVVRGFEPEIYAVSGRYFSGRFFWTTFLVVPTRVYKREQWLAEDRDEIRRRPPRYAVTLNLVKDGIDSPQWFEQLGYARRADFGVFTILERPAPTIRVPSVH